MVKKYLHSAYMACDNSISRAAIRNLCIELLGSPMEAERLFGVEEDVNVYTIRKHGSNSTENIGVMNAKISSSNEYLLSCIRKYDPTVDSAQYEVWAINRDDAIFLDNIATAEPSYTLVKDKK